MKTRMVEYGSVLGHKDHQLGVAIPSILKGGLELLNNPNLYCVEKMEENMN